MSAQPRFELSLLREIGWKFWDPIGLRDFGGTPDDEYDSYLLQAAGLLWNGSSEGEVADYLVDVETKHMGLVDAQAAQQRSENAVSALSRYVSELRNRQEPSVGPKGSN